MRRFLRYLRKLIRTEMQFKSMGRSDTLFVSFFNITFRHPLQIESGLHPGYFITSKDVECRTEPRVSSQGFASDFAYGNFTAVGRSEYSSHSACHGTDCVLPRCMMGLIRMDADD